MHYLTTKLWGRELELGVEFDCLSNEEVLDCQREALSSLIDSWEVVEESKPEVEKYILEKNASEVGAASIDNIFKIVMPQYLYVSRSLESRSVVLLCLYRFDPENGLGILFQNEKLAQIDQQDLFL